MDGSTLGLLGGSCPDRIPPCSGTSYAPLRLSVPPDYLICPARSALPLCAPGSRVVLQNISLAKWQWNGFRVSLQPL